MDLAPFFRWLEATDGSVGIRESVLLYPLIETTHVLTLCLFLGMIALMDLRLMGFALRRVPVPEITNRLLPIGLAGFIIMVISGVLLFYSGPVRASGNIFFRVKMALIALAGVNAALFHLGVHRRVDEWGSDPMPPPRARLAGCCSIVLWSAVVICGRMQAYNWFDKPAG